jgi:imidazoleglycerol-phosphate dehydratase / histidinol-phosphatase
LIHFIKIKKKMQITETATTFIMQSDKAKIISGKRPILFIDRDGTLNREFPPTYQIDDLSKLRWYPNALYYMTKIANELEFELVMITNQDGLGTATFPLQGFWNVQNFVLDTLESQNIFFNTVLIDKTYPHENAPTRKPGIGMVLPYLNNDNYDIANSFVIGDRITDMQLAKNIPCKGIWINDDEQLGAAEISNTLKELEPIVALKTTSWKEIYEFLKLTQRKIKHSRYTNETKIDIELNLDGTGNSEIETGISFFNHMLDQIARHGMMDLKLTCKGDLHIDEHHTIEDTAIALGEAFSLALFSKLGIERYAFVLPMDDCLAQVALDIGGRNWLVWDATFNREKIGEMPTEMFYHFFKSFSDASKINLNIKAEGENEHHKIESIFKAFAKCLKAAVKRDTEKMILPSTKGSL